MKRNRDVEELCASLESLGRYDAARTLRWLHAELYRTKAENCRLRERLQAHEDAKDLDAVPVGEPETDWRIN